MQASQVFSGLLPHQLLSDPDSSLFNSINPGRPPLAIWKFSSNKGYHRSSGALGVHWFFKCSPTQEKKICRFQASLLGSVVLCQKSLIFNPEFTVSWGLLTCFEYSICCHENQESNYMPPFLLTLSKNVNKAKESLCVTSQWTCAKISCDKWEVDRASVLSVTCNEYSLF